MQTKITGKITSIFPDDINTDDIIPAWTLQESLDRSFFKQYAFKNYDSEFVNRCGQEKKNIIVAGENFGCGSSREQAVYALQENNVVAIIAHSYPDIFYRNALNNGLVLIAVNGTDVFKNGDFLTINLAEKIIMVNKSEEIIFKMDNQDALIFSSGGKIAKVKKDSIERNRQKPSLSYQPSDYVNKNLPKEKPQTMVEKIVSDHLGEAVYASRKLERLPIDLLFLNEVIGPPAITDFQKTFSVPVFDPNRIFCIPDHNIPSPSVVISEWITLMQNFAKKQGLFCYKEGDGIEHIVLSEDGYIVPGAVILGTDSHTDTNGAFNTLAFGIGTTDASYALATGYLYDFEIPRTFRINLEGSFRKGVYSKDLILYLLGKLGVDGATGQVVEFGGPGLDNLSMDGRTTIANMAVEMGARTAIFEYDQILEDYLENRAKFPYKPYLPDPDCQYEKIIKINLSVIEPCIAFPHKPDNVTPVSKIKDYLLKSQKSKAADFVPVNSLKITDAFLGACTNGRYEDFVEAAKILKGRKVNPEVNFIAIPASRKIYNRLIKEGILQIFAESGVNIESPNCGPCFGKHMGVLGQGDQTISSSNRNYLGRMGSKGAKIFLGSPVTVAAAAVAGKIIDPRKFL